MNRPLLVEETDQCILLEGKDREEWLALRAKGLGGSDAACTVGENPWKSNQQLWDEKVGLVEPEDISDKPAVVYGTLAEAPLRELFALDYPEYEVRYQEFALLQNRHLPWMQVSLDGQLIDPSGRKGVLEIKTTTVSSSTQSERWNNQVPQNYYCQILHALLVTGWDFAILKAQIKSIWPDGPRISVKHYAFERKDEEASMRLLWQKEREFWKYVEDNKRPPLLLGKI